MSSREKSWILKKINAYFLFIALAFGISAYLLLLDNSKEYETKVNVMISPNNIKTALYLDKIRNNIIAIIDKNNLLEKNVALKINSADSLIEIQALETSKIESEDLAQSSTREMLDFVSRYYDVKNDLRLEIVSRESETKSASQIIIALKSLAIGLFLAFVVQLILDLVEKIILFFLSRKKIYNKQKIEAKKEIDNFFKLNREKIQRLSASFPAEKGDQKVIKAKRDFDQRISFPPKKSEEDNQLGANFKKASSPANLPIAQEDLNKIVQLEKESVSPFSENIESNFPEENKNNNIPVDELREAFSEPTEEEFKKRLNQLLGNK